MPMPRLSIHGLMSLILPLVGQSRLIVRRFAIALMMRDYWPKVPADAMASLALFTANSIAAAIDQLPAPPQTILIAGGGRRNLCLISHLQNRFGSAVQDDNVVGDRLLFSPDMLEAELMAFLAARHIAGLPTSFPATTGCHQPVCGGVLALPV